MRTARPSCVTPTDYTTAGWRLALVGVRVSLTLTLTLALPLALALALPLTRIRIRTRTRIRIRPLTLTPNQVAPSQAQLVSCYAAPNSFLSPVALVAASDRSVTTAAIP